MMPIINIVIEEGLNDTNGDIFTFKCIECSTTCEADVDSNGNVLIHKLQPCKCGLISLHKDFIENKLTIYHLLDAFSRKRIEKLKVGDR